MTSPAFSFSITRLAFDEDYIPAENTRITTNFANLARGGRRRANLGNALKMIDNRFNALAHWDNPAADRYRVGLEIVSVAMEIEAGGPGFPLIEILQTSILDNQSGARLPGLAGNNFSSYLRDYDFSILLRRHGQEKPGSESPEGFGDLHGKLFKAFVGSAAYLENFHKPPVICLSASSSRSYRQSGNRHPILGQEYRQDEASLTDRYFAKMGCKVRFFMPPGSVAPLAFYFTGDLAADYSELELIGTISTMESFQKIYRPEIYNANAAAGALYRPSLTHQDFSLTRIEYDREERSALALAQGRYAEEHFVRPHQAALARWAAQFAPTAAQ